MGPGARYINEMVKGFIDVADRRDQGIRNMWRRRAESIDWWCRWSRTQPAERSAGYRNSQNPVFVLS